MKKNFTPSGGKIACKQFSPFFFSFLILVSLTAHAQNYCANETVYWHETFGTGITSNNNADVMDLIYQENDPLLSEGIYRVSNNTHQKPEWHSSPDHTPNDNNGKTLVVNGSGITFYSHVIQRSEGFNAGSYSSSLFLMNVNTLGTCGTDALLPTITFKVEYLNKSGTWIALSGSPVTASSVPQTTDPAWIQLGGVFDLPVTMNFTITKIKISLTDGSKGGCGNDFAIDDISFALCPSGSPLPVDFLNIVAKQKGSGININWSTSSETNSKYFNVEQSSNGNTDWHSIATVQGIGNSSAIKAYTIYDAKPIAGLNFYRIRQVDKDNLYKYSRMVNVRISLDKPGVTVLTNPFSNSVTIDLLSKNNQVVFLRLLDVTGKQVVSDKWNISSGSSRKQLSGISYLQKGIYYLSVTDKSGTNLLSSKLIKQ